MYLQISFAVFKSLVFVCVGDLQSPVHLDIFEDQETTSQFSPSLQESLVDVAFAWKYYVESLVEYFRFLYSAPEG